MRLLPRLVSGSELVAEIIVCNPSEDLVKGKIRFFNAAGELAKVWLDGTLASEFNYTIAGNGTYAGDLTPSVEGSISYAVLDPDSSSPAPALFSATQLYTFV
jgi:hypothetical protein